jgi:hypothetical protein
MKINVDTTADLSWVGNHSLYITGKSLGVLPQVIQVSHNQHRFIHSGLFYIINCYFVEAHGRNVRCEKKIELK